MCFSCSGLVFLWGSVAISHVYMSYNKDAGKPERSRGKICLVLKGSKRGQAFRQLWKAGLP